MSGAMLTRVGAACFALVVAASCDRDDAEPASPEPAEEDEPETEPRDEGPFTPTFDPNGAAHGSPPINENEYDRGDRAVVPGNSGNLVGEEIRDGIHQRFVGWNTEPDGSGRSFRLQDDMTFMLLPETETLYAQYTTDDELLGKAGPSGGLIFFIDEADEHEWTYLKAAPASEDRSINWGVSGTPSVHYGADDAAIGAGAANTELAVEGSEAGEGNYEFAEAPKAARAMDHGGYDDWFIPSKDELRAMYETLHLEDEIGEFQERRYWSSTEASAQRVYTVDFGDGEPNDVGKGMSHLLRAARAF